MSKKYSIAQVRDHLSEIIHEVEVGEEITVTRRGKPVAVLVSQKNFAKQRGETQEFWNAYQAFRDQVDLPSLGITQETFADVRDKSRGRDVLL
jgi:prevent-host-death family protein